MEESGRNLTPDKLPIKDRSRLLKICDQALRQTVEYFQPRHVIGVGRFAESRARAALDGIEVKIGWILHPSPASPSANSNWVAQIEDQFQAIGVTLNKPSAPARPPARAASVR
jgi:single-strand selective monofunctional uracil DNA glycosylase